MNINSTQNIPNLKVIIISYRLGYCLKQNKYQHKWKIYYKRNKKNIIKISKGQSIYISYKKRPIYFFKIINKIIKKIKYIIKKTKKRYKKYEASRSFFFKKIYIHLQ